MIRKRDNWFLNYHATDGKSGLRHLEYRNKFYIPDDFNNARVIDIGCNAGQMCKYAIDNSASYVLGIEYDKTAVLNARTFLKDVSNVDIVCDDIDNYFAFSSIDGFDTTLFLSVIDTQELQNRYGIMSKLSDITKNVMYYEGHHNSDYRKLIQNILNYTRFLSIEYCGKTYDNVNDKIGRDFFRLTKKCIDNENSHMNIYELIQNDNVHKIAICGNGGSGKSTIRKNLIDYLIKNGISMKLKYKNEKNENMVIYETDDFYIMDDIPSIDEKSLSDKKIILFDYNSVDILKNPDCIFYLKSNLKSIMKHRDITNSLNRTKPITYFDFKYMFHIQPYEL